MATVADEASPFAKLDADVLELILEHVAVDSFSLGNALAVCTSVTQRDKN